MSIDWTLFFPPGARVLALANWRNPRLYLTVGNREIFCVFLSYAKRKDRTVLKIYGRGVWSL